MAKGKKSPSVHACICMESCDLFSHTWLLCTRVMACMCRVDKLKRVFRGMVAPLRLLEVQSKCFVFNFTDLFWPTDTCSSWPTRKSGSRDNILCPLKPVSDAWIAIHNWKDVVKHDSFHIAAGLWVTCSVPGSLRQRRFQLAATNVAESRLFS